MSKTQPPQSLYDAATQFALKQFNDRKAELLSMRHSLDLLQEFLPALAERGFPIHVDQLRWLSHGRKVSIFTTSTRTSQLLRQAFVELGFVECSRTDYDTFAIVDLKKGRLKVHMTVYLDKAAA